MRPLQIKEASGLTTAVGRVIDTTTVVYIEDTVLDLNVCEHGAIIELPIPCEDLFGKLVGEVYFPAFQSQQMGRILVLNPMAASANLLLRIIEEFKAGTAQQSVLIKMVKAYQMMAVRMLSGKGGLVGSHILSTRVANSGRAVLLINADYSPEFVGIPDKLMHGLGIKVGDPVLVGRDPAIWDGSIEIFRARHSGSACVELNPLLFKQFGGDCDGDQVFVWQIPDREECRLEAEANVLSFAKTYAEWPTPLNTPDKIGGKVDWTQDVFAEILDRTRVTGFSIGPREILEQSPRLLSLCKIMDKDVALECKQIAEGLKPEEVQQHLMLQNATQLQMKVKLGPIGAASNRLKVLAGEVPTLQRSACYISERLQQMLLSSKHVVGNEKKQAYSVDDVLLILNRREQWAKATLTTVLAELQKMGMDPAQARPIITYLWLGYPIQRAIEGLMPETDDETTRHRRMLLKYTVIVCHQPEYLKTLQERFEEYGKKKGLTRRDLFEAYKQYAQGLTDICMSSFPVHEIASGNKSLPDRTLLAGRIAIMGETDAVGIGRRSLEMVKGA